MIGIQFVLEYNIKMANVDPILSDAMGKGKVDSNESQQNLKNKLISTFGWFGGQSIEWHILKVKHNFFFSVNLSSRWQAFNPRSKTNTKRCGPPFSF